MNKFFAKASFVVCAGILASSAAFAGEAVTAKKAGATLTGGCPAVGGNVYADSNEYAFIQNEKTKLLQKYPGGRFQGPGYLYSLAAAQNGQSATRQWFPEFCTLGGITGCGMEPTHNYTYVCQSGKWVYPN